MIDFYSAHNSNKFAFCFPSLEYLNNPVTSGEKGPDQAKQKENGHR